MDIYMKIPSKSAPRMIDHTELMKAVLHDRDTVEAVLRILLENEDLTVKNVKSNVGKVDVLAEDRKGQLYVISLQQLNRSTPPPQEESHITNCAIPADRDGPIAMYDIVFMDHDYYKKGLPVYSVSWQIRETQKAAEFMPNRIYVNGDFDDISSPIGKLIHDLCCDRPEQMYYGILARRIKQILP